MCWSLGCTFKTILNCRIAMTAIRYNRAVYWHLIFNSNTVLHTSVISYNFLHHNHITFVNLFCLRQFSDKANVKNIVFHPIIRWVDPFNFGKLILFNIFIFSFVLETKSASKGENIAFSTSISPKSMWMCSYFKNYS